MSVTRKVAVPTREKQGCWLQTVGKKFEAACQAKCGAMVNVFSFEAGHILSAAKGGSNDAANLKPICSTCNKEMGTEDMREYILRKKRSPPEWMAVKFALKPDHAIITYRRGHAPQSDCYVELADKVGILVDVSKYPKPITGATIEESAFITFVDKSTITSAPYSTIYEVTEARALTWEDALAVSHRETSDDKLTTMILEVLTMFTVYNVTLPYGRVKSFIDLCRDLCAPLYSELISDTYALRGEVVPIEIEEAKIIAEQLNVSQADMMIFTDADLIREFKAKHRIGVAVSSADETAISPADKVTSETA